MTAKTRYFLIGSVMVLIIGLSIGLVAFYGGMPSGLFSSQRGPEELKYLPGDSAVVAYANVHDVMNSELRQRLRKFEGVTDEGRSEFKNHTGIDIEQDIDYVVACMGAPGADEKRTGLVVVTGRFDASKIEALALGHGGKTEQYKGKRLVVVSPEHGHEGGEPAPEMAMAFLDTGVVALGTADMVRRAVDRAAGAAHHLGVAEDVVAAAPRSTARRTMSAVPSATTPVSRNPIAISGPCPASSSFAPGDTTIRRLPLYCSALPPCSTAIASIFEGRTGR